MKKTFITFDPSALEYNRTHSHEKKVGPILVSRGKRGTVSRCFGLGTTNAAYVSVILADGMMTKKLRGQDIYIQITPRKDPLAAPSARSTRRSRPSRGS